MRYRLIPLLTLAAVVFGCGPTLPTTPPVTLSEARAAWSARGAVNYDFNIRRDCFCPSEAVGPFAVEVRGTDVTVTRDGAPVTDLWTIEGLPTTAEALFSIAEERSDQADFRVTFDPTSGFLLSLWSDPIPMAADDENGITITELVIRQ